MHTIQRFFTKSVLALILFLFSIALSRCSQNKASGPPELIRFISIEVGKSDTLAVDEIFFAQKYDLQFEKNPFITLQYDRQKQHLILTPSETFSGLTFIRFKNQGQPAVIPVRVKKKTVVSFQCRPGRAAKNIFVMGNFNNWNRHGNRMTDTDGDGLYKARIPLDDGVYEYQFVVDRHEIYDPENPEKVDNGFGNFNSLRRVTSTAKEKAPQIYFLPASDKKRINLTIENAPKPDSVHLYALLDNQPAALKIARSGTEEISLDLSTLSELPGIHVLRLTAVFENQSGNVLTVWLKDGRILQAQDQSLWNDAIIYSVMPDRFFNANPNNDRPVHDPHLSPQANFKGGDLAGIRQKLEQGYFDSLGVSTLWIFPINKTTNKAYREWPEPHHYFSGYHGYWPVSATEVEPRFGTLQEFKDIVGLAHQHKMRVLLDFVSNHVHKEHPFFKEHRDWFGQVDLPNGEKNIRRWDEYRLTTWFDTFLPSFDYLASDEAVETMTDNAVWWLEQTAIDGFRHDATKHVPYKFWKRLTRKIKTEVSPGRTVPVYQIGESFGGNQLIKSYINPGMLDAQFNFNQFFTARRVFVEPEGNFKDLAAAVQEAMEVYGYSHVMGNLMDSHDQVRMTAFLDGDLTLSDDGAKRAWQKPSLQVDHPETYEKELVFLAYLLTVPGIPVIYYGDEIGMSGAADPDNRRMMRFGAQLSAPEKQQLNQVKKLIHLHRKHSALRRGDFKTLYAEGDSWLYTRGDVFERLLVAINKSAQPKYIICMRPEWLRTEPWRLVSGKGNLFFTKDTLEIKLEPYSSCIWVSN